MSKLNHDRLRERFAMLLAGTSLLRTPIAEFFGLKVFVDSDVPDGEARLCCGDKVVRVINLDASHDAESRESPRQPGVSAKDVKK